MRKVLGGLCAFASGLVFGLTFAGRKEVDGPIYVYRDLPTPKVPQVILEPTGVNPVDTIKANLRENLKTAQFIAEPYSPTNNGLEVITEEQYNSYEPDEEDYDKCTVEVFKDDLQSITVIDGETVAEWQSLIGEDAIESLAGESSIYIRNHLNKTDYEVTWGRP